MWPFKPAETILLKKMDANPFYPYILRNDGNFFFFFYFMLFLSLLLYYIYIL